MNSEHTEPGGSLTHGNDQRGEKKLGNLKQITATSSNKKTTDGATSSSTGKQASNAKGHDSARRWMIYGGAGKPMDIDRQKYMKQGLCFLCRGKGHILKNCPMKMKKA